MAAASGLLLALFITACTRSGAPDTVLVMAAASLTDAFAEIETAFEAANPRVDVQLNLAGSATLREQILEGAPADVFAAADQPTMQAIVVAGAAHQADVFAINELQIAVPAENPADITSVEDLAENDNFIGLCAVGVPCGDAARVALQLAGVTASIDTNENDVRALLTKIEAGELDAGIVYKTDVASSSEVIGIDLPATANVTIDYPIAVLADAANPSGAEAFAAFVKSTEAQAILAAHGFES